MTGRTIRTAALVGLVLTAVSVVYILIVAVTGVELSWGFVLQALIHVGELAIVLAVAGSAAWRAGLVGRIGVGVAVLGEVLLIVAELVDPFNGPVGDQIFNVAPPLAGLGMVLVGIAVLRSGAWSGWHRFMPLLVGVWMFVVVTPLLIAFGGPPVLAPLLAVGGWDLCWALAAVAVLAETPDRAPAVAR
jgi:hypothetical protein